MKNKYYLDIQTDPLWTNETMAIQEDTLGMYGCLVTALSNTKVLQNQAYSPKILNNQLKLNKGYAGLRDTNLTKEQSFLLWDSDAKGKGACEILGCKKTTDTFTIQDIDNSIKTGKIFFIVRILVSYRNAHGQIVNTGHYINILYILNNKYMCFDTYDGKVNVLEEKDITTKIKIDYS